ncbi:MAG: hypothetical protein GX878_10035, partial [Firmicutes bacterium]|nr:hypothetical protein [Bacillota bacterium]
ALAIQTGHYIQKIPSYFIKLAAEHGIPVIEIPFETSFKELTRGLLGELMRRNRFLEEANSDYEGNQLQATIRRSRELLNRLKLGENPDYFNNELLEMHILPDAAFYIIAIKAFPLDHSETLDGEQAEPLLLEPGLIHLLTQHKLSFLAGPLDGNYMLLLQAGKQPPEQLLSIARRILNELRLVFPQFKFIAGASSIRDNLTTAGIAMEEAQKAMHIAGLDLIDAGELLSYDNLGIFKILSEIQNSEPLKSIFQETVSPLLAYDERTRGELMQTLRVYLKHLNISRSSRELFIHRHTMKYRLNQIEELTKLPLDVPGNVFKLHLGLLICDYLQARGIL